MAGPASAETMLQASRSFVPYPLSIRESLPWQAVNSTLLLSDGIAQWKGVRLMYLQLLQHHRSVYSFARDSRTPCLPPATADGQVALTEPGAVVRQLVNMLHSPFSNPKNVFPEADWGSSATPSVVQTQMAGLLLSILVILSLGDDRDLQQQLNEAGAVQLLCKMAIGMAEGHHHPDILPKAEQIWADRRDVQAKLHELYKLIPIAIASICQATGNLDSFMQDLDDTYDSLSVVRQKQNKSLVANLKDDLILLQHMHFSSAADSCAASGSALQQASLQQVANAVTLNASRYLRELQSAYKRVISGYDENQTGNCLYWLQKAPCLSVPDQVKQGTVGSEKGSKASSVVTQNTVGSEKESRASSAVKKKAPHDRRPASALIFVGVTFFAGVLAGAAIVESSRADSDDKHEKMAPKPSHSWFS